MTSLPGLGGRAQPGDRSLLVRMPGMLLHPPHFQGKEPLCKLEKKALPFVSHLSKASLLTAFESTPRQASDSVRLQIPPSTDIWLPPLSADVLFVENSCRILTTYISLSWRCCCITIIIIACTCPSCCTRINLRIESEAQSSSYGNR